MKKIGISVDYSNICKGYNTVYLDRDNTDPETTKCMRQVMGWMKQLLSALYKNYESNFYNFSSGTSVNIDDIASKRFLFYSLEKEITLQTYIMQKEYGKYESLADWENETQDNLLIKNDEDGGAVYFYFNEGSSEHQWIKNYLVDFSVDEIAFEVH